MALPEKPLSNPLRNWQCGWPEPCQRLCCHCHPDICPCADICCDGCGISIVRPDGATTADMRGRVPSMRYVCLDCPVDMDYEAEHWEPTCARRASLRAGSRMSASTGWHTCVG